MCGRVHFIDFTRDLVHVLGFYSGVCSKVHIHIKRTDISQIPISTEEQKQWIFDRFQEKEE